jgi:FkbM family methyltransferase
MISKIIKIPFLKRLIPSISIRILKFLKKNRGYFKIKNIHMFLDYLDPIDREIILLQEFEKLEINYLSNKLDDHKAKFFLDIGSNCGYYSVIIAKKFPKIKIFAFEPNQEAYFKFNKTLKKNPLIAKKITSYNFGLSNLNTKLIIKSLNKHGYAQTGGSSIERKYDKGTYTKSLEDFKIGDRIINIKNSVIGIKIDVEGHEFKVLEGLQKTIKYNRCIIQIEIIKKNFFKIDKLLSQNNFRLINKIHERSNFFYKNF